MKWTDPCVWVLAMAGVTGQSVAQQAGPPRERQSNRTIILKLGDAEPEDPLVRLATAAVGAVEHPRLRTMPDVLIWDVPRGTARAAADFLAGLPGMGWVEVDQYGALGSVPTDPYVAQSWHIENTGQVYGAMWKDCHAEGPCSHARRTIPTAAGHDLRLFEAWGCINKAPDIVVAVVDTGVNYEHAELKHNMWVNAGELVNGEAIANGLDDDGNGIVDDLHGARFDADEGTPWCESPPPLPPPGDPMEGGVCDVLSPTLAGHGTSIAALIGGAWNGAGSAGVCRLVQVMAVRTASVYNGYGTVSSMVKGVDYAVSEGADIINCSWGFPNASHALEEVFDKAHGAGRLMIVCAHNQGAGDECSGADLDTPWTMTCNATPDNFRIAPQRYSHDNIIVVAALSNNGRIAEFSNWGRYSVDLAAPGQNIWAPDSNGPYTDPLTGMGLIEGTSFSAPLVAGVAALVWQQNPSWTAQQVRARLLGTVTPHPDFATTTTTGGVLNAAAAVGASSCP